MRVVNVKDHGTRFLNAPLPKEVFEAFTQQKQIDLILDKISKSGYDSLTQAEKDFLFRAGKK